MTIRVKFVNATTGYTETKEVASGTTVHQFLSGVNTSLNGKTRATVNGVSADGGHVLQDGQTVTVTLSNVSGA